MEMVVSRITTAKRALLPDVYIYVNIEFCVRHGINLKKMNKNRNIRFSQQKIFSLNSCISLMANLFIWAVLQKQNFRKT